MSGALMVATSHRADVLSSFGSGDGKLCLRPTCVNLARIRGAYARERAEKRDAV